MIDMTDDGVHKESTAAAAAQPPASPTAASGLRRAMTAVFSAMLGFEPGFTSEGQAEPAWLGKQILLINDQGLAKSHEPDQLRLINRADCTVAATLPNANNHKVFAMTAAPGVTVIASMDDTGTYLDGYY